MFTNKQDLQLLELGKNDRHHSYPYPGANGDNIPEANEEGVKTGDNKTSRGRLKYLERPNLPEEVTERSTFKEQKAVGSIYDTEKQS